MIPNKMSEDERERRRAILRDLKERERAQFIASLPASKSDIRDLFVSLDNTDEPCDHTLNRTREFLRERGLPEEKAVEWLEEHGGFCDCEVISNVEDEWNQKVEEEWQQK